MTVMDAGVVAPHVEVALGGTWRGMAGALEPGVLVGGVVDDQLGDDADVVLVGGGEEAAELAQVAVVTVHGAVVGDVVAVVAQWRGVEGQQPDLRDAEVGEVVEPRRQPVEVADPVAVGVGEGAHVELVDDRVAVPVRWALDAGRGGGTGSPLSPAHETDSTWKMWAGKDGSRSTKLLLPSQR